MKAARLYSYSSDQQELQLDDVPTPQPKAGQALIRVLAAGVNPLDNMIAHGEVKLITPYKLPLIAGNELVGIIESINAPAELSASSHSSATTAEFKEGQRVFARLPLRSIGAFAEYVAVDLEALAPVPDYLTTIQAAAVPLTALTITQALELMNPQPGQTIFISGGTGGVGAMAIPLAVAQGLTVITNGSARNKERVMALGTSRFLDYATEDYAAALHDIDFVLDTRGGEETEKQMSILRSGGHLVSLKGMPNGAFARRMGMSAPKRLLFTVAGRKLDRMAARYGITYDFIFVQSNGAQLRSAAQILQDRNITPSVDTVFPFEQVNEALVKVANGHSRGKTVLSIAEGK